MVEWIRRAWSSFFNEQRAQQTEPVSAYFVPSPPPIGSFCEPRTYPAYKVPAQGDVFNFEVQVTITWRAHGVTRDQLREMADSQQARIQRRVRQRVNEISRNFPPHRALKLEQALNLQFGSEKDLEDRALIRWKAKARVLPDERVREKLRPFWERRIEMDSEHELRLRRVELAEKLTKKWTDLLVQLHDQRFTLEGAKLAEQELAKIMQELKEKEADAFKELKSLLEGAASGHSNLGLYEYAETYDKLIAEYRQRIDKFTATSGAPSGPAAGNGRAG